MRLQWFKNASSSNQLIFGGKTLKPKIFVSAVTEELKVARDWVANTLDLCGRQPIHQENISEKGGDLLDVLRKKIDECKGVIQLVGYHYGAELPRVETESGPMSYTQYEAKCARELKKKIWFLIDDASPTSKTKGSNEPHPRQEKYRKEILRGAKLYHRVDLNNENAVKCKTYEINCELDKKRRTFQNRVMLATVIIGMIIGGVFLHAGLEQPSTDDVTEYRANQAFIAKNYSTAYDIYVRLSDNDPTKIEHHRRIAECARFGNLKKPFMNRYHALVNQQPDNEIFRNYLGNAYLLLDRRDKKGKAREQYEMALGLKPDFSLPLAGLGIIAQREGRESEAEDFFKRYVKDEAGDARGWVNLGLHYVYKAQTDPTNAQVVIAAEKAMGEAIRIDPGVCAAYKGLGKLYNAIDRKKDALYEYGLSYECDRSQDDVRELIETLARELGGASMPGAEADSFELRGWSDAPAVIIAMRQLDQGRYRKAADICLEWIKAEPENLLAWRLLERAYKGEGRSDEAIDASYEVLRLMRVHSERLTDPFSHETPNIGDP